MGIRVRAGGRVTVRVVLAAVLSTLWGCSGGKQATSTGDGGLVVPATPCDPDPLRTGLTDRPNIDDYDCLILDATAKYGEPDAMIFKAIIWVESRFQVDADGCTNLPCGTPSGWSAAESHCFGMMQIVPACNPKAGDPGLLPSGHPNLSTDTSSSLWATSIFNPAINIDRGVAGVADNRQQVKQQFPGCTEEQYTLMAIGNYNSYGSTKSCTVYNTDYDNNLVLPQYQKYCTASGWTPRAY